MIDLNRGLTIASDLSGRQVGDAPISGIRAWVYFNGTGVVAIRGSNNVSSVTDNNTGDYTINFTTALPNANYAVISASDLFTFNEDDVTPRTTSACRITTLGSGFVATDSAFVSVMCVG